MPNLLNDLVGAGEQLWRPDRKARGAPLILFVAAHSSRIRRASITNVSAVVSRAPAVACLIRFLQGSDSCLESRATLLTVRAREPSHVPLSPFIQGDAGLPSRVLHRWRSAAHCPLAL